MKRLIDMQPLRALSVALAMALALACTPADQAIEEHLAKAEQFRQEGSLREAVIELKNILNLDPTHVEANLRLANLYYNQQQFPDALFYFEEAYRLAPDSEPAAVGVLRAAKYGQLERAREVAAEAAERHPASARLHIELSNLALIDADADLALSEALTAVELGPELAFAHLQLGVAYRAKIRALRHAREPVPETLFSSALSAFRAARAVAGDEDRVYVGRAFAEEAGVTASWPSRRAEVLVVLKEAHAALARDTIGIRRQFIRNAMAIARQIRQVETLHWTIERALELDPEDPTAWEDLVRLEKLKGGTALEVAERRLAASPDSAGAHIFRAKYVAIDGRPEEALAAIEAAMLAHPADSASYLGAIAGLAIESGDAERARSAAARLAEDHPDEAVTFTTNARVARSESRWADAVKWLERWAEASEAPGAYRQLAEVELRRGDAPAALDAATRAVELANGRVGRMKRYLCTNAIALERNGQYEAAQRMFRRANRATGSKPPACDISFARTLFALDRDRQANELLDRLIARDSIDAVVLFARENTESDPERARELVAAAAERAPGDARLIGALARFDLKAGEPEAALARVRAALEAAPGDTALERLMAQTMAAAGDVEGALAKLEAQLTAGGDSTDATSQLYLRLLAGSGRLASARERLETMESSGALGASTRVALARMRMADQQEDEGIALLESVLADDPDHVGASNELAYALANRGGDLERATELAQSARGFEPDAPAIADTLGWVFFKRGLANAALAQFDAAIELAEPQSSPWATAQYHRALALGALDRPDEALVAVEQALASGADFAEEADARELLRRSATAAAQPAS